jgi:hypothetical protein
MNTKLNITLSQREKLIILAIIGSCLPKPTIAQWERSVAPYRGRRTKRTIEYVKLQNSP